MKNKKIKSVVFATILYGSQLYTFTNAVDLHLIRNSNADLNAPMLSIYEGINDEGIKVIKADAWDNDGESGIEKIEFPDGTFVMVKDGEYAINTEYIPTSSGTYVFKAYDKNGNFVEKSITISINDIPPMIDAYIEKENIYDNTVTISINSWVEADGGAKLDRLELPDGTIVRPNSDNLYNINAKFIARETGEYIFKVYDIQGLYREKSLFIQLDDNSPNMEVFFSNSISDSSKRIIHIDAWDNDNESGIHKIVTSDGYVYTIKSDDEYSLNIEHTPTKEGVYTFKAYDKAGHYIEKSVNYSNDFEQPKISCAVDIENNKALITLDAWTENGNSLSKIKMPDGSIIYANPDEYSKTVTFEADSEGYYDFMVIDSNGYSIKKRVSITLDDFNIEEATKLVEKAELTRNYIDIQDARNAVNSLLESASKDLLQDRLNNIFINIELDKKTVTSNVDVYIKSENMLSLSLDTNNVMFEDFSGIDDVEKFNVINLTVNSSLPYEVNSYLITEIQNMDKTENMNKDILNIKENGESTYQKFDNIDEKIVLKDNCNAGNNLSHSIDIKLKGGLAFKKDTYKTVIKFEINQK